MNTTYRRLRDENGFTLVELLIVIVILGVLAGIVVFAVGAFNNEGVSAACEADMKAVEVAQEAHKAKTGNYAASTSALVTANYLRTAPSSTEYTVTTSSSGAVVGTVTDTSAPC